VLTIDLRPGHSLACEATGFRLLNRVDLPPGRYQLRLAARATPVPEPWDR
jgi:hypothetical protein